MAAELPRPGADGPPDAAASANDLPRVRAYTRWSLVFIVAMAVVLPLLGLVDRDDPAVVRALIVAGVLVVGAEQLRLLLGSMGETDPRALARPRVIAAGVVALGVLAVPAADPVSTSSGWMALPYAGLVGATVLWLPAARRRAAVAAGAVLGAVTAVVAAGAGDGDVVGAAVAPVITVVFFAGTLVLQLWIWNVTLRLDEARTTAGELAVLRERLRFSADLHDVQGHHLQAISLKAELTRRLIGRDDDAARGHAADVQDLTLKALAETRELVRGYRRVPLVTELENAVQILRAAGVETTVGGTPEQVPEPLQPLFGSLVREGATNLLRHTRATSCTLTVEVEGTDVVLRVRDDGTARTPADGGDPGTGVVGLRERFAAVGGRVDAGPLPDRGFALTGRAPR